MIPDTLLESVLEQCQADGVTVSLADGKLVITGQKEALDDWRPVLRELKPELLELMKHAARPINKRAAALVRRGIDPATARVLALQLVTRDVRRDDRRVCAECVHLSRIHDVCYCAQGRRIGFGGTPLAREQVSVLHRCRIFAPLDDETTEPHGGMLH